MLLQRSFESVPAGAESAIHVPISLYHCGLAWASFMCFGSSSGTNTSTTGSTRQPGGEEQEQEHWQEDPISLTTADVRHFDELRLPGVDVGVQALTLRRARDENINARRETRRCIKV